MAPKKNPADQASLIATFEHYSIASQQQNSTKADVWCFLDNSVCCVCTAIMQSLFEPNYREYDIFKSAIGFYRNLKQLLNFYMEQKMYCNISKIGAKYRLPFSISYFSCEIMNAGHLQYTILFIQRNTFNETYMSDSLI